MVVDVRLQRVSKFLSYVLRHRPDSIGVELDEGGWLDVDTLLAATEHRDPPLTRELIEQVVRENDKQRFRLSEDGRRIRANQGHSVEVQLELAAVEPPAELFHGTAKRFLDSILATGLDRRARHHVHLSADVATASTVGRRHGELVVLRVASGDMQRDGHVFHRSHNGVWLTEHVPERYLTVLAPDRDC